MLLKKSCHLSLKQAKQQFMILKSIGLNMSPPRLLAAAPPLSQNAETREAAAKLRQRYPHLPAATKKRLQT
ncbi:MAG: hypothetical protein FWG09_06870, partial [Synergistaceae bacterium]|nr:hypothetical protein [Synergistaceae bacterium]